MTAPGSARSALAYAITLKPLAHQMLASWEPTHSRNEPRASTVEYHHARSSASSMSAPGPRSPDAPARQRDTRAAGLTERYGLLSTRKN
jgi:hypothetical protein